MKKKNRFKRMVCVVAVWCSLLLVLSGCTPENSGKKHYSPKDNSLEMTDDVHVDDGSNYKDGDIQIEFHYE